MFSLDQLRKLRLAEIEEVAENLPTEGRILEIGAGTGEQSAELVHRGFEVSAIDLASSNYSKNRVFEIVDYDGANIPFPDASFAAVFSSNVLEHVAEIDELQREIRRVLVPGGLCIHLVPTPAWRLWSAVTVFIAAAQAGAYFLITFMGWQPGSDYWPGPGPYRARVMRSGKRFIGLIYESLCQPQHGERGNRITELCYFSRKWWMGHFQNSGFEIVEARPAGLFYTGFMALGPRLSIETRCRLAPWLGSACHWFVVKSVGCDQK